MRMFLVAIVVIAGVATGASMVLDHFQRPASVAFATDGARIDPPE
jgi:hypothetical protein